MPDKRKILQDTLNHRAGQVPIDFGSTAVTGIHVHCIAQLREHYGLELHPVKVIEPYQMLGEVEADLGEAIGIDVVGIMPPNTMFGFRNERWKPFLTPWGQEIMVPDGFETVEKANGDLYIFPEGDTSVPPSGHMPSNGFFFDTLIRQNPIEESELNPDLNTEEFEPVTDQDLDYFQKEADRASETKHGVAANFGGTAIGDIALVPAPFLKHPRGIRDVEEWYISTVTRQDYLHAVFSRQTEIAIENLTKIAPIVKETIDVVFVCGTDFGSQNSAFCSVETFNSLYAPYYKMMNDWIHEHTSWKTFKHSCGAVAPFLEPFTRCGFDIINPVQCSAAGMDPEQLKDKYGKDLVFWGGGVDTQGTLPFGSPEQVREEVLRRCEIFSRNGGFVFNAIHNLQANAPIANVIAMIEAVQSFNGSSYSGRS